jgi:hypothetical protein
VELSVVKLDGTTGQQLAVSEDVFATAFREPLVHQVVVAYLSGARSGTSSQKTDPTSAVAVQNPGDRRVLVVRGPEQVEVRSGVEVAGHFQRQPEVIVRKLTAKCIGRRLDQYCRN